MKASKVTFLASFEDYLSVLKRNKSRITFFTLASAFTVFSYIASRPVGYEVEATFREQGLSSSDRKDGGLTSLMALGSSSDHQSRAITVLKSKNLMKRLVDRLGLQAEIVPLSEEGIPLQNLFRNIKAEAALLLKKARPGVDDFHRPIRAIDINYPSEVASSLSITPLSDTRYLVEGGGKEPREGIFGEPFREEDYSFTLMLLNKPLDNRFNLTLKSKRKVTENLSNKIKITPDPKDKRVVNLKVIYEDRVMSSAILNSLMELYREWLEEENQKVASEQIQYLRQREDEENLLLTNMLYKHACDQADKMNSSGFASNLLAMDFLTKNLQEFVQRISAINFEVERLSRLKDDRFELCDASPMANVPPAVQSLFSEIRTLKMEADALSLSVKGNPKIGGEDRMPTLGRQLYEIDEAKDSSKALRELLADLQSDKELILKEPLKANKKCALESWIEKMAPLQVKAATSNEASARWEAKREMQALKEQFSAYLVNLIQYFQIQEKTLKERLQHLSDVESELEGMGLSASKELLAYYNKELSASESQIVKNHFLIESIKNKEMELSPLASMIEDPIGKEIANRYSKLLLDLQNPSIRSQKEQERIREELLTQRGYLEMHISQSTDILGLKTQLLRDAIYALQGGMLSLYREQISILEKQVSDFISQRIDALEQEKGAVYDQIFSIRDELKAMPEKRIQELMIEQKIDLVKKVYTQIVQTIEAKNLQSSMEVVQSVPVDTADTPYFPKNPHLLLLSLAGAFLGFLFSSTYFIAKEGFAGLRASPKNLTEAGLFVAGRVARKTKGGDIIADRDLETLRRLMWRLNSPVRAKTSLLLEGNGPHYGHQLASLFSFAGEKVLLISLCFDQNEGFGLLDALEKPQEAYPIQKREGIDFLASGGPSRHGTEKILSKEFKVLLETCLKNYDRVIAYSDDTFEEGAALAKTPLFEHTVVTIDDETVQQVGYLASHQDLDKLSYLFTD
ncbi:hypothetical protein [Estrella lausannensis]|uniref:Putatiave tyrosine-protein kinase n=1 Tax=Estrella lausannensis TaxID=483423 RepID=A0A0H5DRP0_9BACT|nr:hypothetical protein [Estrella lausannensis]CRX38883.1 Putatiave tyrosine-protein kinase [Estrella lausannensis]